MSERSPSRLQELDALRGIAALVVMFYHYTIRYPELIGQPSAPVNFPMGQYGVQLFFVISGFVIFLTLTRSGSIWDFAANRFGRLYPPYWACIAITFTVLLFHPLPGLNVSGGDALLNLSMLQLWMKKPEVDGVYWSMAVELSFYCFVTGLHVIGWLKKVEQWVAAWLALIFLVHWADLSGLHVSRILRITLMLEHGHFFFAGVLFYRMKNDGLTPLRWLLLLFCIITAWYVRDAEHAASLAVASILFVGFITGRLGWIVVAPLIFLGDISYPLYLLHQYIGYAVISRMRSGGLTAEFWLLAPVAVSLLLAVLVNRLVEKPARQWLREKWTASGLRARLTSR